MTIDRRQFLNLTMASGLAVVGQTLLFKNKNQSISLAQNSPSATVYSSQNGLLEVNLEAKYSPVNLGNQQAYLYTYNGQIPAPRLLAQAGDRVKINFTNKLSQPTNLHYHGLHIPPTGTADNVFLEIKPQQSFTYEFQIPDNHPSGTFWYHPHFHGYTAEQLAGGLAGLFIIKGKNDPQSGSERSSARIPQLESIPEEFLVLQDFALDNQGKLISSNQLPIMFGREGNVITVNGQIQPNIEVKGGLLRLKILNGSTSRFYRLSLENQEFVLISTDGGMISQPQKMRELLLTPGQRAEILLQNQGNNVAQYRLVSLPYQRSQMGMMGGGMMGGGMMGGGMIGGGMIGGGMMRGRGRNLNSPNQLTDLATIKFNSADKNLKLPTQLTSITPLPKPSTTRQFILNHGMSPGMGMTFLINGQEYQHNRIDTEVKLNTVEDWEIINNGVMDHPFHLHVNPFQVISRNGIKQPFLAWRDTVLVRRGETVKIRVSFRDFAGKTVYHCHILDHEDLGMMANLNII